MHLTFTGIDEWTDLQELQALEDEHEDIEFAVLAGSPTRRRPGDGKEPRFPSLRTLEQVTGMLRRPALHLCGRLSRQVNARDLQEALKLAGGFSRVQINARTADYDFEAVAALAAACEREVIVQHRQGDAMPPSGIAILQDSSGGRGLFSPDTWDPPQRGRRTGYAGGLRPGSVGQAIAWLTEHKARHGWLDMESGIRTGDRLDTGLVRDVIAERDRLATHG